VLALLVAMIAGLESVRTHEQLTVVAVVDQSESVRRFVSPPTFDPQTPREISRWSRAFLRRAASDKRPDDRIGLVSFDGRPTVRALPSSSLSLDAAAQVESSEGSDAASAMRLALAGFSAGASKRIVLISDGNDTSGQLEAAAREARAAGVRVDVAPLDYQIQQEVVVERLYAPSEARKGQTIPVRVVLSATRPAEGTLYLKRDGQTLDLNGSEAGFGSAVSSEAWVRQSPQSPEAGDAEASPGAGEYLLVRRVEVPTASGGAARFEAVFEPAGTSDTIAGNNRGEAFTMVRGQGKVLLLDTLGTGPGEILPNTLRRRGIELDVLPAYETPGDLVELNRYDAVLLQNVPADLVPPKTQRQLAGYVSDLGGGLVMIGGDESFGAGAWNNSPVDRILPVSSEIPSQTVLPSGALVLVLDRSGSMGSGVQGSQYTQQELANEAGVLALSTLFPRDLVGVVAFDSDAEWISAVRTNSNPRETAEKIRSIQPGGGTNIYPGLRMAYEALAPVQTADAAIKHVVLLSDGQSAPGDYHKVVGDMAKAGITLSTIGVGDGHDAKLLSDLANMGGGQYHPISNPNDLPQVFVKEAKTIRKNLIKEKTFDPVVRATGSPVMADLGDPPVLHGLVRTEPKRDPRVFMPIVSEEGEPVFAHWQVGLGRTAAFTSDATNRWAVDWLQWSGYPDFWARMVRHVSRTTAGAGYDLLTEIEGDRLRIRLDASGASALEDGGARQGGADANEAAFLNFLEVRGTLIGPDGEPESIELSQTGPGRYEASVPAKEPGSYLVNLYARSPEGKTRAIFGGASRPPGQELRRFRSDRALLERVAEITGGRVLDPTRPENASLFTRKNIDPAESVRPLWRPLMVALFVLLLLDVASRRIAWDPPAIARNARRAVERLRSPEIRTSGALDALRRTSGQTRRRATDAASSDVSHPESESASASASESGARAQTGSGAEAKTDARPATAEGGPAATSDASRPPAQQATATLTPGAPPSAAATRPRADRKFIPSSGRAKPDADLAQALGGARPGVRDATDADAAAEASPADARDNASSQGDASQPGPTTSRLLDAKRRARERMKKNQNQ